VQTRAGAAPSIEQAVGTGWTLLPAAALFSISAGQALAALLVLHWFFSGRFRSAPKSISVPLAAFLGWTLVAAFLAEPAAPDLAGAVEKWIFALTLPAAYAHAARGGSVRGPMTLLLAAGITVIPFGFHSFLATAGGRAGAFSGSGPHLGSNLMMGFVIFLAVAVAARGPLAALLAAAAAVMLGGLGLTLNRSALLGAAAGTAVVAARRRPLILAAVLALLTVAAASFPVSKPVLRLRSALLYRWDQSSHERVLMWSAGCRMIRARPLAGFASRRRFMDAYESGYRDASALEPRPGHVHNSYLQTGVLHGIPGLGLLLWWLTALWRLATAPVRQPEGSPAWREALIPLLVAVLVNAAFDFVLADGQHALMWYALTGLLLGAAATVPSRARTRA